MTFRFEKGSGDIYTVQELLGPRNISTTQKYLGINYADARAAVEAIALVSERDRTDLLSRSFRFLGGELKATVSDETLFLELALRGYDLSRLRTDEEATGEIIKFPQAR